MVSNGILVLCCIATSCIGFLGGYTMGIIGKNEVKQVRKENAEHCVCCGRIIPEGRQVCGICEKTNHKHHKAKHCFLNHTILHIIVHLAFHLVLHFVFEEII